MRKLYLIDANALVHRCFHALPPLASESGRPTGALYGLASIFIKVLKDRKPDFVAVFFDRPEPTFRKKAYDEYKIHRPKAPDELVSQLKDAREMAEKFGVKIFETPGYEADDLIASAAEKFKDVPDLKIIVLTGDLDALQLVSGDKVVVETLKKGISETVIYNEKAVEERFGVSPKQLADYKGLVGDPSDNIPGVSGIGPKTAAPIIKKFGTLENFFLRAGEDKTASEKEKRIYQKILSEKKSAEMSKYLAVAERAAPLNIQNISDLAFEKIPVRQLTPFFEELGFKSLAKRIGEFHQEPFALSGAASKKAAVEDKNEAQEQNYAEVLKEIEEPLTPILRQMEEWGIKADPGVLADIEKKLDKELAELTAKIISEAGESFNINSPKQLNDIFLKKFRVKLSSTRAGKLEVLKEKLPLAGLILRYRELFKLKSTYVAPLKELALKSKDSRIRTTFTQYKVQTGRLSSENPNLQNVPDVIRSAFVAEKGYQLASFDYSQIELRVLATLSGDKNMIDSFLDSKDIHVITASRVFGVLPENVKPQMRSVAKTLNFGVSYGMGARAFAQTSGLPAREAALFIKKYFSDFPEIKKWHERILEKAREEGFVENLNGRKRFLPDIVSFNPGAKADAERMAINFPVQSLAADIIKLAMIKTKSELEKKNWWGTSAKLLLSIHDELLFEIKDNEKLPEIISLIKSVMESVYQLDVPLKVNEKIGKSWGEL